MIDDVELQEKVGTEEYEIVVANILADVIIPMAPVIPARLKQGGYFITSGIIDFRENDVKEAIEKAGLRVIEINHQGEWVNVHKAYILFLCNRDKARAEKSVSLPIEIETGFW